jgi:arabinan endo-1,5-alpha-L-arabinosidase
MSARRARRLLHGFFILAGWACAAARGQVGDVRNVHDPCIIRDGEWCYVFYTGRGLPVIRSRDLLSWERVGRVFDGNPEWIQKKHPDAYHLWAPDIAQVNGRFRLYYAASTFGQNRSTIGWAVNETLDPASPRFRWVDQGPLLESVPGRDDWNAIDPQFVADAAGRHWLAFGSYWSGIKLRRLDPATGRLSAADTNLYALACRPRERAVEAPFIVRRGGFYYLFVSFDQCCRGTDSTYHIRVGRAREITGPYVDRDGRPMMDGGGTLVLSGAGRFAGPGHNAAFHDRGRDWLVHHYYDGEAGGLKTLQIRPLEWTEDGWPKAGAPLPGP